MKTLPTLALLVALIVPPAYAMGRKTSVPVPVPVPSATPAPVPTHTSVPGTFVTLGSDIGPSVDPARVTAALDLMNQAYSSGCLRASIEGHEFLSLNSVFTPGVKTSKAAADEYLGGAPYAINPRWYRTSWPKAAVIGYTYNFENDDWSKPSETRIWTNTRPSLTVIYQAKAYAAHLAHELSHQARAGGFVHYTIFGGSFPYDVGDLMSACLQAPLPIQ